MQNKITKLFNIKYPVIQGGMIWVSGYKLAAAVSNAGGLGLIGAGSMYPDVLRTHIQKCKKATDKPFGVNIPLFYPDLEKILEIIAEEGIKIVFSSAGNPKLHTSFFHDHGIKVAHVVSSVRFALKAQAAGVDAVVAEGFEAGGHNGKEETTTFTLIPMVKEKLEIPLIAAGGIATGRGMLAAMALGADGVQIGSRFVASEESSAHINFKKKVVETEDGGTDLTLKELIPVRLIKNDFYHRIQALYENKAGADELIELLGRARPKLGMFEGDLDEGELEIGQVSAQISEIKTVSQIFKEIISEYNTSVKEIGKYQF
jgi:enoyl-[acyl-carrier protein] reductase II